jgi:hypothetical protein
MPAQNTMLDQILLSRVHYELIRGLVRTGACPNNSELAEHLRLAPVEIEELLRHLSEIHGVVLHPSSHLRALGYSSILAHSHDELDSRSARKLAGSLHVVCRGRVYARPRRSSSSHANRRRS